jgi:hypothetical protein
VSNVLVVVNILEDEAVRVSRPSASAECRRRHTGQTCFAKYHLGVARLPVDVFDVSAFLTTRLLVPASATAVGSSHRRRSAPVGVAVDLRLGS